MGRGALAKVRIQEDGAGQVGHDALRVRLHVRGVPEAEPQVPVARIIRLLDGAGVRLDPGRPLGVLQIHREEVEAVGPRERHRNGGLERPLDEAMA